jgi:hypothetical protein
MFNSDSKNKKIFYIGLVIFIGCFLRYHYFTSIDGWYDEWNMLYTIDPNISNEDTWKRYYGYRGAPNLILPEYYPPLNAFFMKFILGIFGYNIETTRLVSIIFGSSSLFLVFYLSKILTNFKYSLITTIIASLNLFLIWQSSEIRPHSFVVFFSLLSLIYFFKILDKDFLTNKKNYFFYLITSLILLSSWPFTLIIYFAKVIYLIQKFFIHQKKNKSVFFFFILILIFYVYLNIDYLIYHLSRDEHYTKLYSSFFYSYHFRSFFGSISLGAIFLVTFGILLIINLKKIIFKSTKDNLLIIIILSSYFLTIMYSVIGASVISPKYIIFILPLIIIWITLKISNSNFKYKKVLFIFLLISTILNAFINFQNNPIDRPPTKKILKIIALSDTNKIFTQEEYVFNNFINIHKISKKNKFIIKRVEDISPEDKNFWFLCLNNPRFAVGDNNLPEEEKCKSLDDNQNLSLIKKIKVIDYILKKYEN